MCKVLLLAILLTFSPVRAHAQDSTARVVHLLPDSTQSRIDSLVRAARRKRERGLCQGRESFKQGAGFAIVGGVFGAALGAVPATVLSLLKHHDAARATLWTPTAGGAVSFGAFGMIVGAASCG